MKKLLQYIDRVPKPVVALTGVLMALILGVLDHTTGYEISFSIFYLIPVALVSWFGGKSLGIFVSLLSAGAWLYADLSSGHSYSHFLIPVWNGLMRFGFFAVSVFSLSAIRSLLLNEQALARTDSLTGVLNSRAFSEVASAEIKRSLRFSRPFTIAYIDIDNFKQVNDTLGHSCGDDLLKSVAERIQSTTRSVDITARLGGDEFAVLLPETNELNAMTALNKVKKELLLDAEKHQWPVTFSIGVVTCYEDCNLNELIREADNLMYAVKHSGKNRIESKVHKPSADAWEPESERSHPELSERSHK